MLLINYDVDDLPKTSDICLFTVHHECPYDEDSNLDWIEERGQVVFVITCEDGLAIFVRTVKDDPNPWYHVQKIGD